MSGCVVEAAGSSPLNPLDPYPMKTAVANCLPQAARWLAWVLLFVVSLWNCTPFVQAQSFIDVSRPLPDLFPGVKRGSVAWADYDIDGRPDLLITGHTSGGLLASSFVTQVVALRM
jgi:hypothetical protein